MATVTTAFLARGFFSALPVPLYAQQPPKIGYYRVIFAGKGNCSVFYLSYLSLFFFFFLVSNLRFLLNFFSLKPQDLGFFIPLIRSHIMRHQ